MEDKIEELLDDLTGELNDADHIGVVIKSLRTGLGMSVTQLANACKLNIETISQYENGVRKPNIGTVEKIARALKVSPGLLVCSIGSKKANERALMLIESAMQPTVTLVVKCMLEYLSYENKDDKMLEANIRARGHSIAKGLFTMINKRPLEEIQHEVKSMDADTKQAMDKLVDIMGGKMG